MLKWLTDLGKIVYSQVEKLHKAKCGGKNEVGLGAGVPASLSLVLSACSLTQKLSKPLPLGFLNGGFITQPWLIKPLVTGD